MNKMNFAAGAAVIAMAAGMMSACSSDDNAVRTNYPKDNVVRVVASVSDRLTRGSYNSESVNKIGLDIYNSESDAYTYTNVKLEKGADGKWKPAQLMLWQNATQPVYIVAYAPYNADVSNLVPMTSNFPVSVQPTQTADDNSSDFLVFKYENFIPGTDLDANGAIPVKFRHALSQLEITIKLGTEFDQAGKLTVSPIKDLTVGGTKTSGTCDFDSALPTALGATPIYATGDAANVEPYEVPGSFKEAQGATGNATATYSCILIPQTVAAGEFSVSFTIGDKAYSWTSTGADVELMAGSKHSLELTVGRDVVVPGTFTVKPWTDGGSTNVTTD